MNIKDTEKELEKIINRAAMESLAKHHPNATPRQTLNIFAPDEPVSFLLNDDEDFNDEP